MNHKLRDRIREMGLNASAVDRELGLPRDYTGRWCRGVVHVLPDGATMAALLDLLCVDHPSELGFDADRVTTWDVRGYANPAQLCSDSSRSGKSA